MAREAVSTADDTSPLHGVSRRLAERQVQTPPWCLEYWPGGYTMARLARENRAMAARAHSGGTTVVLCHAACATLAHDCLGGAMRRSALKVAPQRRMCTLTAPRWCRVTELVPCPA